MKQLPFQQPGRFYRGNLHTHSTRSDGRLTPEQVCQFYREAGYDFIALTDHFLPNYQFPITDTEPFRTENFTTLLGAELHTGQTELGNMWHLLGVGLPADFPPTTPDETGPQLAARALEAGAYVAAAHPHWYTLTEADILSLGSIHAIEIFNATAIDHNDRYDSWYVLDLLLTRGHRYHACATDDAHFIPNRFDAPRGWVWVKSESLSPTSILEALKAGHYYSSTGPQIYDIQVRGRQQVTVRCSPATAIFVSGARSTTGFTHGHGITQATINLYNFDSPYCRVTVRDMHGGRAWSNPIWFED